MVERIKQIMANEDLSSSQFADTVEIPRAVVSHILSGRNKPSLEVVTKIIEAFPDLNIRWLMLGEGEMLKPLAEKEEDIEADITENDKSVNTEINQKKEEQINPKVQEIERGNTVKVSEEETKKEIEQIVVFYTDKTFMAYKP